MSSLNMPKFGNTQLPTLSKQLNLDTNFGDIIDNVGNLKEIAHASRPVPDGTNAYRLMT